MVFLANLFKGAFDIWLENASYEELADDHEKTKTSMAKRRCRRQNTRAAKN